MKPISHIHTLQFVVCLLFVFHLSHTVSWATVSDEEEYAALRALADSLHSVGSTDSAIKQAELACNLARRSGKASWILGAHSSLGVFLRSVGKVDEALAHYDEAMQIATTDEFRRDADEDAMQEVAALYLNLSVLHYDMAHKDEALRYAVHATEWAERCADKDFKGQIYTAAVPVITTMGDGDTALEYQQKGYAYTLEAGSYDAALKAAAYTLLSYDKQGKEQEVDLWRSRCLDLLSKVVAVTARLTYFQVECSISIRHERPHDTIAWMDSILSLDGIEHLPFVVLDCYNNMHLAYAELGRYDMAYETLQKGSALRDSLYEQSKAESLRELTVKYDAKEKELALAVSEAARSEMRLWLVASLSALVVVGALFVAYSFRQRQRRQKREAEFVALLRDTDRQLTTRYIEGLESERARMARELHDGVCNDLIGIQMRLAEENPMSSSLALLNTCREQVRRISHEMMPPEFTHATIDEVLRYYVFKISSSSTSLRCHYSSTPSDVDWSIVPDNISLEMYRIVQEAMGNAMKHSEARDIYVGMVRTATGIELTISDNGMSRLGQASGIGRRTMRQRAAASGGNLTVESGETGTVVRLILNIPTQA